ncbi:MAG: PilM, partial [uncultured bacterium]
MSGKKFVSIYFTQNKLQVARVDKTQKEVELFASVDIPPGLIAEYKVKDPKALSEIVKKIWLTHTIKEKLVGLVVPEFSTFTKSIDLPQVPLVELDEAVRWEAQDFLPTEVKDSVMDWKITRKLETSYQILSVAIPKDILAGFVDAVSLAGLFPIVVETPSLSLSRISDGDATGSLVIYANVGEAILLVREGEKILGSSVVDSSNQRAVLQTAIRMIAHYETVDVKKVQVGGMEIGKELYTGLSQDLKLPVEWMQFKAKGLDPKALQNYLIPLSLQLKDPTEPSDENSINLLPPSWVKSHRNKKLLGQIKGLVFVSSLVVLANFVVILIVFVLTTTEVTVLERASRNGESKNAENVIAQIEEANELGDNVVKIASAAIYPQTIINAIKSSTPESLVVTEYKIDMEEGNILVRGSSVDRQQLLTFKRSLEEAGKFSKVSIPVSSFEKERDLEFEASFAYLDLAKTNKKQLKLQI